MWEKQLPEAEQVTPGPSICMCLFEWICHAREGMQASQQCRSKLHGHEKFPWSVILASVSHGQREAWYPLWQERLKLSGWGPACAAVLYRSLPVITCLVQNNHSSLSRSQPFILVLQTAPYSGEGGPSLPECRILGWIWAKLASIVLIRSTWLGEHSKLNNGL